MVIGFGIIVLFVLFSRSSPPCECPECVLPECPECVSPEWIYINHVDIFEYVVNECYGPFGTSCESADLDKLKSDVSLEDLYYGSKISEIGKFWWECDAVSNYTKMHYNPPQSDDLDSVIYTYRSIQLIRRGVEPREDLGKWVDINWLEENSILNPNLDSEKLSPIYQFHISYLLNRVLILANREEEAGEIRRKYLDTYSDIEISDEDYLKAKYYQTKILFNFGHDPRGIFSDDKQLEKEKREHKWEVEDIYINKRYDRNDLGDIFYLYTLRKYYGIEINKAQVYSDIIRFYTNEGGFKEHLGDESPSMEATYYGMCIMMDCDDHSIYIL